MKLSKELFAKDALVFKGLESGYVTLKKEGEEGGVKVTFRGFPVLIVWSKGDGFVCIEPCEGCDDAVSFSGEISEKEFIVKLNEGDWYDKSYRIKIT